jgi:leader peptidase (prepilin peptidase)/N-methyltransferase
MLPEWVLLVYAGFLGAVLGSFLNVCIYRWPLEQSVVKPRSRCPGCGASIRWFDNIPMISWLLLRGRCRHCGTSISVQYPLVELSVTLIWLAAAMMWGLSLETLRMATFLTILLGIAFTDAQHMVIPDQFSLGGMLLGILLAALPGGYPLRSALLGAVFGFIFLWIVKLAAEKVLGKPALGVGDIHMIAMIGAFVGIPGALLTIFLGSVLGLLIGVPYSYLTGRLTKLGTYLPLGVFLAMGGAISFLWGEGLIAWYLRTMVGIT